MSTGDEETKGICILSFDSGGPGTYSQLLILKEYMSRLANDLGVGEEDVYPADYFDLMGGVGFGGLVSVMLGHLRMNVDEAIDALINVATAIFAESEDVVDPEANSERLRESLEEMLQTREIPVAAKMHERDRPQTRCKVVLYAATSANINHPQAFRTYAARGSSLNPTIVEAVRATMAVPSLFSPVKIGPRLRQQSFIGGAFGANNPTRELLKEASTLFGPNRRVAQVLSLGCGLPRAISTGSSADDEGAHRLLKDIAADCEMVAQELSTRLYTIDAYLRLNVDRGMELITMTDWNELGSIESQTAAYIAMATVTGALDTSVRHLQERIGALTLGQINHSSSIKITAKLAPSVSPYFVLRAKEWEKLVWHLVTSPFSWQRIFVITGMGGCGKTQMVSYFLREYPSLSKHAVFVDASTLSSIKADLQAWARVLGNGHERDVWEDAIRVLSSIPQDERWVLILDNADDPTLDLVPFMPNNTSLTILITSRNRNLGNMSTTYHMELGEMGPDEALTTLLHSARRQLPLSPEESTSAQSLLKELGCLAVAIVQAGTYCHELSYSFTKYLSLFYSHRPELMKRAEPSPLDSYKRGAYTTLDLSYKALPQDSRDFLRFISFFHHADIPLSALATAAKVDFNELRYLPRPDTHGDIITDLRRLLCADGNWSEMQVQDTLRTLRSFSLLSITSLGDNVFLHLHPLVQAWARDMNQSISQPYRAMTLLVLTTCSWVDSFQLHRYLLPHILDMIEQVKGQDIHVNDLMGAGKVLHEQAHYQAAAVLFETALEIVGKIAGDHERTISTISSWLAAVYRRQNRWEEVEKIQVKVLEQYRRILGADHPHTIRAAGSLAATYSSQGRWSEAEKMEVEVLEQWRRVVGMEHPDTLTGAANLAWTYRSQGRWSEAEKLEVEVLEKRRRILGMEHPHTILAAANLASTYRSQGRWSEAEKLQVEVLEQRRRILGLEHPDTIMAATNLAATYNRQGRWEEDAALLAPAVKLSLKVLGQQHPHTQLYLGNLRIAYEKLGMEKEAQETRDLLLS